jgi:hypothetical protein
MGNKIDSKNSKEHDSSLKLLNELIPRVINIKNEINDPVKYFSKLTKSSPIKTKSNLSKVIRTNYIKEFGHVLSDIIITNRNEKNFNMNIYTTSFICNDEKIFQNIGQEDTRNIEQNEYSNFTQINYLNKIITSNKILKRIYDYDSSGSNNDSPQKLTKSNNMATIDHIDLQEYLKIETERLKNDPIYQAQIKKGRNNSISAMPEGDTYEKYSKNFNIVKNKHLAKKNLNQTSSFNPLRPKVMNSSKDKPIKISQMGSMKNFNPKYEYNNYKTITTNQNGGTSAFRTFSESVQKVKPTKNLFSSRSVNRINNTNKSLASERVKSPASTRTKIFSNNTTISASRRDPIAKIRIDLRDLKDEDDNSMYLDTELLKDEMIEKLVVRPTKDI